MEVIQHLRRSCRCRNASVIVASTSNAAKDREAVMGSGANAYFRKPSEYEEFLKLSSLILEWFPKGSLA